MLPIPHPCATLQQGINLRPGLPQGWLLEQRHPHRFLLDAQLALHSAAGQVVAEALLQGGVGGVALDGSDSLQGMAEAAGGLGGHR